MMQVRKINSAEYYIILFNSKNHAIHLNYLLEKKGYRKFQLISTPCRLSKGCSYSLKFNKLSDLEYLKRENKNLSQLVNGIYEVQRIKGKKTYKKLHYVI